MSASVSRTRPSPIWGKVSRVLRAESGHKQNFRKPSDGVIRVTLTTVGFDYASTLILGDERLLKFVQEDSSVDSGMRGTTEE